jgi:Putative amidoligase enzyme
MKIKYNIKMTDNKIMKTRDQEKELSDLLTTLPILKRHKLDAEIGKKVRQLRNGRKSKAFTLELTRKYHGKTLAAKASVEKVGDKLAIIRKLKDDIKIQIQKQRKETREMIVDTEGNLVPIVEQCTIYDNVIVPKQDATYLNEGSFYKAMMRKIRKSMNKNKSPEQKDLYIGVEIELAAKQDREAFCDRLFDAGLGKYLAVKDDGSIGSEGHTNVKSRLKDKFPFAHEICVLVKQSEFEAVMKKLCDCLSKNLEVAVDKTCGLHVHLDMRTRQVEKCFNNLVLSQQFLYAMLPAQRRTSSYSIPVKGAQYRKLGSRYHGINQQAYDKYKTLELRMHCGTTNEAKIVNWTKLLIAIVEAPALTKAYTKFDEFATAINLDPSIKKYVEGRISKFADQHAKSVPDKEEPGTMPNIEKIVSEERDLGPMEDSEVA